MGGTCSKQTEEQKFQEECKNINQNFRIPDEIKDEMNREQGRYILGKGLGSGAYGFVALAFDTKNQQKVAIKFVEKYVINREDDQNKWKETKIRIQREILYHQMLTGHPNIVSFKELFTLSSYLCIVMEYVPGGNLHTLVAKRFRKRGCHVREAEARDWFRQLIFAVERINTLKIINRDIKLENILIQQQRNGSMQLKLCDFGFAKHMERDSAPFSLVGSRPYLAPEVLFPGSYSDYDWSERDIWSCGVTLYCLLFGKYPFDPRKYEKPVQLFQAVREEDYKIPDLPKVSYQCKLLIHMMLTADPSKRITLEELKENEWFKSNSRKAPIVDESLRQNLQSEAQINELVEEAFQIQIIRSVESQEWMDEVAQLEDYYSSGDLPSP